jgi:hypothetical protein
LRVNSRSRRKRYDRITARLGGDGTPIRRHGPIYWAPRRLSWLIGALFMIGSACFAVGPIIAITGTAAVAGVTFFIGSIFFTSAAYGQVLEVANAGDAPTRQTGSVRHRLRALTLEPRRIEWWATSIQFAGTIFFNISTFAAMQKGLSVTQQDRLIWAPDVLGSICFLVASYLAYIEVCGRWWCRRRGGIAWWIAVSNLVGSIAFGLSAIASYVIHDTGELLNAAASNGLTLIGGVMFFIGAYMLWPETAHEAEAA